MFSYRLQNGTPFQRSRNRVYWFVLKTRDPNTGDHQKGDYGHIGDNSEPDKERQ